VVLAGVAGQVCGDVQDAVAQPFGFAHAVFTIEAELLGPDRDVMRGQRELQPRGVGRKRVKRQMRPARRFERLDAVLNLSVLAVRLLQRGEVVVVLVGDHALKTVPIQIGERQLRSRVRAFATHDQPGPAASQRG